MVIKKVRDNETVTVHANAEKTVAGSRHYIHAEDVAEALLFLYNHDISSMKPDDRGAKCQKFNIVGKDEIDNLELAQFIAQVQDKPLNHEMVDFHSQRPGHDLRYALDGSKMKKMGWEPKSAFKRLESTIKWTLKNDRWLSI
jgi:dTDP-glucose 4,6-dehydratase